MAIKDFYQSFVIAPLNGDGFSVTASKIIPAAGEEPENVELISTGFTDFTDLAAWFATVKAECE